MKEQLITFKTAKLAKEKGFDWECAMWNDGEQANQYAGYRMDSSMSNRHIDSHPFYKRIPFSCTIPTQSLLQKWLREKHNIHIDISISSATPYKIFYYRILHIGEYFTLSHNEPEFNKYEEALEKGLYEALELIKV